jgi:hypothetical protein
MTYQNGCCREAVADDSRPRFVGGLLISAWTLGTLGAVALLGAWITGYTGEVLSWFDSDFLFHASLGFFALAALAMLKAIYLEVRAESEALEWQGCDPSGCASEDEGGGCGSGGCCRS